MEATSSQNLMTNFYSDENNLRSLWPLNQQCIDNYGLFNAQQYQQQQLFHDFGSSMDSLYYSDQLTSSESSLSPISMDQSLQQFDFASISQTYEVEQQQQQQQQQLNQQPSDIQLFDQFPENLEPEIRRTMTTTNFPTQRTRLNSYCETVAVESSGHVAQIVGKNGCKIKHLRAKYGTYIHTPSTTDEPVFIIKGQRDKVKEVKQEIIKADNHFSSIKEARNVKISKIIDSQDATTIRLFIPTRYIGLVVGRNGWFVKDLQQKHQIYIETPKFELCCYFQLYGPKDKLMIVKKIIFDHIFKKTGIKFNEKIDDNSGDIHLME